MLNKENTAYLRAAWQTEYDDQVKSAASIYLEQFGDQRSGAVFCAGLSAIALTTSFDYYRMLSTALCDQEIARNIPINDLIPWHVPGDGVKSHVHHSQEVGAKIETYVQSQKTVGFVHGHYRLLTPANWANVIMARERCDILVLGMEDGWRTKKFKSVQPFAKDWLRWQWVLASGFDGLVMRISKVPYSDSGYTSLLKKLKPTYYFGNNDMSSRDQDKMFERAEACNCEYISLPRQTGFSTTQFLSSVNASGCA
ncbi:MAG: hypothetical protein WDZ94_03795 [Patescibacteria group bacterium]